MLGFFVGFAVKLPVVGVHTWLPDAHTEAPTAGSVVLAGLLLKTGAYGLLRFALPLFPAKVRELASAAMILGTIGILYGAFLAFAQVDAKRLVAYTSISHLGFALLGIYAGNRLALQGAIVVLLAHGLSTGGLFVVVGALQERLHTRRMDELGGLVVLHAAPGRCRDVSGGGLAGPAGAGQLRRRISRADRHVRGESLLWRRSPRSDSFYRPSTRSG